jgi:thiamine biosynthesis protein ThiI
VLVAWRAGRDNIAPTDIAKRMKGCLQPFGSGNFSSVLIAPLWCAPCPKGSMKYLIKYAPEMTTKSRVVRNRFCRQLRKNLARILREQLGMPDKAAEPHAPNAIEVEANWDNLQVHIPEALAQESSRVEEVLANTPGIWVFNRVREYPLGTLDDMLEQTFQTWGDKLDGRTFVVRCRRAGRHPFNSMDVERHVGGGLLHRTQAAGVDLHAPGVTVMLEVRNDRFYVVEEKRAGMGGFPLGTQDAVLSLISGGFDSAVATWLAMKRGMRTHFLFFNLGGSEHELAVKEVAWYLWQKFGSSHGVQFITVPFEAVVGEILEKVENSQMGVILKRMMLRAADKIADQLEVKALVTGESVAQVSSQTLMNLAVIDRISTHLVLRPLVMTDKPDIIDTARKIGTAEFSAAIPEYCGVISVRPTTRAKLHRIEREEARMDFTVLETAVNNSVNVEIRTLAQAAVKENQEVGICDSLPAGGMVIDIRHPDEEELQPLGLEADRLLKIPFYRLSARFAELDSGCSYWLYCGKGVMSRLHAAHLMGQGHRNVGVYKPA